MTWIFGNLFAICIGISLGLLGGGGSVLALPVLVYVMGVSPKPAIAMTLVIVGSVSLLGSIPHARRGNLNLKIAGIFGSATMVGAYLGARIATLPFITSGIQMLLFGISMLIAAGLMIYRSANAKPDMSEDDLAAIQYVKPACKYCWLWLMTEGIAVGILTGLVGVGGGFAIVPALVLLGNIPMKKAIGTSLLIIACNSFAGLLGYLGHISLNWTLTVSFTFLAGCGTVIGAYLAQFVSPKQLQKSFGYFLLAVATFVLVQNRDSLQNLKKSSVYQQPNNRVAAERISPLNRVAKMVCVR
ncbi:MULTISPECIES: sulfite exporter TauE/SafE family protein [unclassified Microcoleus]|uniref:sulfite exporter TauE/SafE family protein n=1 Tax=unclassified Microcoleus TaxID=2642155 RepID=UPI0025E5D3EC|nr:MULTISPECIES: sulfite exporter TauE/SafE family protein [unclassified Microcoleus]